MPMKQQFFLPPPKCRLHPSTGSASSLPGRSCKHIRNTLFKQCYRSPQSGIYWVKVTEQCSCVPLCLGIRLRKACSTIGTEELLRALHE